MSLLDRFRPRWRDPDPQVRRAAVKRLDDLAALRELAADDPDASVREAAAARASEVMVARATSDGPLGECEEALAALADDGALVAVATRAAHPGIRSTAVARLATGHALRDVVRKSDDAAIRDAALARIDDATLLRSIALAEVPADLAIQALERIDDPAVLAGIASHHDASKTVRRRARELAPEDASMEPPARPGDVRARQHELCVRLEAFADAWDCDGVADRIRAASEEWSRLASEVEPKEDVQARFARAREAALVAVTTWERRRAEALHVERAHDAGIALAERMEALDAADDPRSVAEARAAWAALDPPADAALDRRFRAACDAWEARHATWAAARRRLADAEAVVVEATALADAPEVPPARAWKAVAKRWAACAPSDDGSEEPARLRARFDAAAERVRARRRDSVRERERRERRALAAVEAFCTRLDEAAAAETLSVRAAARELRAAEAALANLESLPAGERSAWAERLTAARDRLWRRHREAEEAEGWRRFANAGVQEELIGRLEALLASGDLAAATKQLGEIQEEWKRAATAPRDRSEELWSRFRTARDELHRRCETYQAQNLERKQALCDAVALLADSTDWNATATEVKRLQAEWKAVGPVPPRHAQALWRRFREPCDRFFARRQEHFGRVDAEREENAKRKVALCEQAEALADSKDWEGTANTLKRLQAKWKEIGPVPRKDTEALWQRFRGACDRFFDRRSRRDELEREEHVEAAEAACAALEASAAPVGSDEPAAPDELGRLVDAAWAALHALDDDPGPDTRAIDERFHAVCERLGEACREALAGTRVDPEATRGRREKICARLEALTEVALEPPRELSLEEQALRLKARLAAKTIGGTADPDEQRRRDATDEIGRLRAQWARLGPPLGADARAAAERFARACARLDAADLPASSD
jgi:hypothetical protein